MAVETSRDVEDGKVSGVVSDEKVLDPDDELAVQVPPEADASNVDALAVHEQPTPEEVFAASNGDEDASDAAKAAAQENAEREAANAAQKQAEKDADEKRAAEAKAAADAKSDSE